MAEDNAERLTRLEERVAALVARVSNLEADRAKFAWLIVGGVITALLSLVVVSGR